MDGGKEEGRKICESETGQRYIFRGFSFLVVIKILF